MMRVNNLGVMLAFALCMNVFAAKVRAQEKDAEAGEKPAEATAKGAI